MYTTVVTSSVVDGGAVVEGTVEVTVVTTTVVEASVVDASVYRIKYWESCLRKLMVNRWLPKNNFLSNWYLNIKFISVIYYIKMF